MTKERLWHILRLWMIRDAENRTEYLKRKRLFADIGTNCSIMDRWIPLYPNLIRIGNNVHLASKVLFCTHDITHIVIKGMLKQVGGEEIQERLGCIDIKDNVFIGANTIILYNTRIGPNVIVAAGSVVVHDVPENSVVAGVPARIIGNFNEFMEKRIKEKLYPIELKPKNQRVDDGLAKWLWEEFDKKERTGKMRKILIIGAGGFGRELLQWIKEINNVKPTWEIAGFLDDDLKALDNVECDYKVIGTTADWIPKAEEDFVLAIGDPGMKEKVSRRMKEKGAHFPAIIHPTATVTEFTHYGEGLVMFPYSKISVNSTVGDFVTVLSSGIGHDVKIGDFTTVSGMCSVLRNVTIGKSVFIAAGVSIAQDITIGDKCYLGLGSVILKDVPEKTKTFGNPARFVPVL